MTVNEELHLLPQDDVDKAELLAQVIMRATNEASGVLLKDDDGMKEDPDLVARLSDWKVTNVKARGGPTEISVLPLPDKPKIISYMYED